MGTADNRGEKLVKKQQREDFAFCDGASSGNPGPGGWAFLFCSPNDDMVKESADFVDNTTNNRMELLAMVELLRFLERKVPAAGAQSAERILYIYSDSRYAVVGATFWVPKWKRNEWKTEAGGEVLHQDLWMEIETSKENLKKAKRYREIELRHVDAHSGIAGNERVDTLAVAARTDRKPPHDLYEGPVKKYFVNCEAPFSYRTAKEMLQKSESTTKKDTIFYISEVDGEIQRHETWKACESRVKGKSGARFKKITCSEEEKEFLKRK